MKKLLPVLFLISCGPPHKISEDPLFEQGLYNITGMVVKDTCYNAYLFNDINTTYNFYLDDETYMMDDDVEDKLLPTLPDFVGVVDVDRVVYKQTYHPEGTDENPMTMTFSYYVGNRERGGISGQHIMFAFLDSNPKKNCEFRYRFSGMLQEE